ncbi:MAG: hypothetical protein WDW36_002486 [Sanguina aurantia]
MHCRRNCRPSAPASTTRSHSAATHSTTRASCRACCARRSSLGESRFERGGTAKACKVEADKLCNVSWFFGYKSGQVISCLRDTKAQVSKSCKKQVFKVMLDAAVDIRADPMLFEACKDDTEKICKDVKHGGGRVQACLRDKRMQLSWACEEQLFRQEMENADDVRLSVRLFSKCLPDKKKFCADIEPGNARTKDCLEEHRTELSTACKPEVDSMIERRVRDFRLDSRLRSSCETEIFNMCAYFGDLDDIDTYDSSVINCLQDYSSEIKTSECKKQVKKYVQLAAQDIRFDVPLAEACFDDRQKLLRERASGASGGVFPGSSPQSTKQGGHGSARVIRCLTNSRDKLSPVCRATLFDEEVRFSENIDFQYPMKTACVREISQYCKDIPHGNAKVIRCLQNKKDEKDFGKPCREEVVTYEAEISKDYRLNFRLNKACTQDVTLLCPGLCTQTDGAVCGGKVLRCLTDKLEQVQEDSCKKEVAYFEKMEVSNFRNDIILAEACREDVDKFCPDVESGDGRVHRCLREKRKQLSERCRAEELLLEEKESGSIELSVNLLKACNSERRMFCKEVQTGQARVFRCLAENMNDADFGNTCKYQIINKMQRRQANWKLDPPLRKACRADVAALCAAEDSANSEDGRVYKCLVRRSADIAPGCAKELGRAVHMAFYVWQPGATITSECDDDIQRLCLAARPSMATRPGAVGSCLASILERSDRTSSHARRMLADDPAVPDAQPRPEDPKPEEPKIVDAKPEEPKKEEAKKEEPEKEEAKPEEPKKEEAKKEAPKKDDAKVEAKVEEPKKEEVVVAPVPAVTTMAGALNLNSASIAAAAAKRKRSGSDLPEGVLGPQCFALADIAEPPNAKAAFESALSFALLQNQLERIEISTGLPLVTRDNKGVAQGVSLTGWMAMLGITALLVLISYGGYTGYKKFRGIPDRDYTLVVKQQHPPSAAH